MRASRSKRATRSGSGSESGRQDLYRDIAPELRVARAVHLAHAAGAQQRHNLINADLFADQLFRAHPKSRIPNPESGSERVSATLVGEQRFHFSAQRGVTDACLAHERRAFVRRTLERVMADLFDAPPALITHLIPNP